MQPSPTRPSPLPKPGRLGPSTRVWIALALLFYAAALSSGLWGGPLAARLPEEYLSGLLLGLAIGFQTLVIADWQRGRGRRPRPLTLFLLTAIGGGLGVAILTLFPDLWRNALVLCATALTVTALPGLVSTLRSRSPSRRTAQARARDAGLATAAVLSLTGLLTDLSGLVSLPLWLALTIGSWIAATAYTGTYWWHKRRPG